MHAEVNVKIYYDQEVLSVKKGTLLSEILKRDKPCGGHGKCGKCRVKACGMLSEPGQQEKDLLSPEELAEGVRLACCTSVLGDCIVDAVSKDPQGQIVTEGFMPEIPINPVFAKYGVALDIGTTTLAARLYDRKGQLLAAASCDNPQSVYGADVISRLEYSLKGDRMAISRCICAAIDDMLCQMVQQGNVSCEDIHKMVVTGNTAMLYLLTGRHAKSLSCAPFAADHLFGESYTTQSIGLTGILPQAEVYLPPCISTFVGADMVCAVLASRIYENSKPALLVDMGTNGEMGMWDGKKLSVCAAAAGPAFEGGNISKGMRGSDGAIDAVLWDGTDYKVHVIGECEAKGICGSGLIDAVSYMLCAGVLEESGYLDQDPFPLHRQVSVTGKDIRMVQLAKGAICAGICVLLETCSLEEHEISEMYVAGGFGKYLNMDSAAAIGLFPVHMTQRASVIGNAALSGASMLLLNDAYVKTVQTIAAKAHVVELSSNTDFVRSFTEKMLLRPVFQK